VTADISQLNLDKLTDSELLAILEMPEGKDGLRHYMSKADKVAWVKGCSDTKRRDILKRARAAQQQHHAYLRNRRATGPVDKPKQIEQKLGNDFWRYRSRERVPDGFRDEVTGRKAKVAYIIENTVSGKKLKVTKSTVQDAFERLGTIQGWPPVRGNRSAIPMAGEPTLADLPKSLPKGYRR
jgi:hypothetical protein